MPHAGPNLARAIYHPNSRTDGRGMHGPRSAPIPSSDGRRWLGSHTSLATTLVSGARWQSRCFLPPNKTQAGRGGNLEALNPDVGRASTVQAGGNPEAVYSETLAVQRQPKGLSPPTLAVHGDGSGMLTRRPSHEYRCQDRSPEQSYVETIRCREEATRQVAVPPIPISPIQKAVLWMNSF